MRLLLVMGVLLIGSLHGCIEGDTCETGEMRCSGDQAQMCNADLQWVDWLNCEAIGEACYTDRDHCGDSAETACCG